MWIKELRMDRAQRAPTAYVLPLDSDLKRHAHMGAPRQFFLRRARTHFWASELATIPRQRGIRILGRERYWGNCPAIRLIKS